MEKYLIMEDERADNQVVVQRVSDGLFSCCPRRWLKPDDSAGAESNQYVPKSNVKAVRLDGLDWTEDAQ